MFLLLTKEGLKGVVFDEDRQECVLTIMGMDEATESVLVVGRGRGSGGRQMASASALLLLALSCDVNFLLRSSCACELIGCSRVELQVGVNDAAAL